MDLSQRALESLIPYASAVNAPWQAVALATVLGGCGSLVFFTRNRSVLVKHTRRLHVTKLRAPRPKAARVTQRRISKRESSSKEPDIVICTAPTLPNTGFESLPLDQGTKDGITQLMRSVPGALTSTARAVQHGSAAYILRLSPRAAQGIGNGSVAFMPALKVSATASSLTLHHAPSARMVALDVATQGGKVFFGVWHVVALLTAQKMLYDIGRRIASLEFGLAKIKQWLENQLYGSIEGNYLHLRQIAESLQNGGMSENDKMVFSVQVEAAERELRQSSVMLKRQLEDALIHLRVQQWSGIGLEENYQKATDAMNCMERWSQALLLTIHVRALGAGLRGALGLNQAHSTNIIGNLLGELDEFAQLQGTIIEVFGGKIKTLKGKLTFASTDGQHQHRLKQRLEAAVVTTKTYFGELYESLKRTETALIQHINQQDRPLVLRVTINGQGEVKSTEALVEKLAA